MSVIINTKISREATIRMNELSFQPKPLDPKNSIEKTTEILKKQPSFKAQTQFEQVMNMPSMKKNVVTKVTPINKMQSIGEKQIKISKNSEIQPIKKTKEFGEKNISTVSSVVNKRKREDSILPEAIEAAKRICSNQQKELRTKNTNNVIAKTDAVKTKTFWSMDDDQQLLKGYETHGTQWMRISEEFLKGKFNRNACMIRYSRVLHPDLKGGKWSEDERKLLLEGVKIHGKAWTKIAQDIFKWSRSDEDCRQEYTEVLDPNLQHGKWTRKDEKKLLELHNQGFSWSYCGNAIGRSADKCAKKYQSFQGKI